MKQKLLLLVSAFLLLVIQNASSAILPSFTEDWSGYQPGETAATIITGSDWGRYSYSNPVSDPSLIIQSPAGLLVTNNSATFMGLVSKNAITLGNGIRYNNTFSVLKETSDSFQYVRLVVRSAGSENNLYIADIRSNEIILRKKVDGASSDLTNVKLSASEFSFFTEYKFSLEIEVGETSNEIRVFQNGELRLSFTDTAPPALGTEVNIGFLIRQGTAPTAPILFGEIGASPIPEPSSLAALAIGGLLFVFVRKKTAFLFS